MASTNLLRVIQQARLAGNIISRDARSTTSSAIIASERIRRRHDSAPASPTSAASEATLLEQLLADGAGRNVNVARVLGVPRGIPAGVAGFAGQGGQRDYGRIPRALRSMAVGLAGSVVMAEAAKRGGGDDEASETTAAAPAAIGVASIVPVMVAMAPSPAAAGAASAPAAAGAAAAAPAAGAGSEPFDLLQYKEIGTQLTFGAAAGFCSGYALKKVGKAAAFTFGAAFIAVQVLRYYGVIGDGY